MISLFRLFTMKTQQATKAILIKKMPTDLWRKFKAEAVRRDLTLSDALSEAISKWEKTQRIPIHNMKELGRQ